jgi:hypothetical protein
LELAQVGTVQDGTVEYLVAFCYLDDVHAIKVWEGSAYLGEHFFELLSVIGGVNLINGIEVTSVDRFRSPVTEGLVLLQRHASPPSMFATPSTLMVPPP